MLNDLHDAEVEVGVLGVLVELLLERPVQVNPPDLGVRAPRDVPQSEEVRLQVGNSVEIRLEISFLFCSFVKWERN